MATCEHCGATIRDHKPTLVIPALGPSLNEFFGRMHYGKRTRIAGQYHALVKSLAKRSGLEKIVEPVEIAVRAVFSAGRRRFDAVNISPTLKLVEDGLRYAGILENDSPRFVPRVSLEPVKGTTDRAEVWITPIGGSNGKAKDRP